jgi:peptidyl-prolyl cis-trans isomerase C
VRPSRPDEDECRRYYDSHQERFRTPDLFEAAHILIEPEGPAEKDLAIAEHRAREIAAQVGDDPSKFAAAAREQSKCASAQQDGSLGQVRRGELVPSIQQGLEELREGETGREPVRSRFGWHVLRLHRKVGGRTLTFDMARPRIADMLEARSWSIEAARYVSELARRGDVQGVQIDGAAD